MAVTNSQASLALYKLVRLNKRNIFLFINETT